MAQPGEHPENVSFEANKATETPREGASGVEVAVIILSVAAVLFWLVLR